MPKSTYPVPFHPCLLTLCVSADDGDENCFVIRPFVSDDGAVPPPHSCSIRRKFSFLTRFPFSDWHLFRSIRVCLCMFVVTDIVKQENRTFQEFAQLFNIIRLYCHSTTFLQRFHGNSYCNIYYVTAFLNIPCEPVRN